MSYQQLTADHRVVIAAMHAKGCSRKEIARIVGCHAATITREFQRNATGKKYEAKVAGARTARRRAAAALSRSRKFGGETRMLFDELMSRYGSVSECAHLVGVSATAAYRQLRKEYCRDSHHNPPQPSRKKLKNIEPFCYMRFGRYRNKGSKNADLRAHGVMAGARPVHERSAAANARTQFGHWEVDTVIYRCGVNVLSVTERRGRLWRLALLPDRSAASVVVAVKKVLHGLPVRSITSDRGTEFAGWREVEKHFDAKWYVCDAGRPDQRGSVENANGWLRWLIKRGATALDITQEALREAENFINNRPRAILGHRSAAEVMGIDTPEVRNARLRFVG